MKAAYAKAGWKSVKGYQSWYNAATGPYPSGTHGGRYVNNYADDHGDYRYKKFEESGTMPFGSVLAKDSFQVSGNGKVSVGPLFVMEKMGDGFNANTGNWRYVMIMPNGSVFGATNGKNSKGVAFCAECHNAVGEDQDYMFFLPEENRR